MRFASRLIRSLWALPVSVIGLALILPYGPRFVRIRNGVLHVGVRWLIGLPTTTGQTFGEIVFTKPEGDLSIGLWRHEMIHVDQCRALGPLIIPLYPLLLLTTALQPGARFYLDHPLEVQAQKLSAPTPPATGEIES